MIDTVQAVLLFVIVLLTILFVVLGIQIFFILKDFRETVQRTNRILDNAERISESVSSSVNSLTSLTSMVGGSAAVSTVFKILSLFRRKSKE